MICILQRVREAQVTVDDAVVGKIGRGLMVLVCAEREDTEEKAVKLAQKLLRYRVFSDDAGKMNKSVKNIAGDVLVISQFTLAADTNSGNRPSFTPSPLRSIFEGSASLGLKDRTRDFRCAHDGVAYQRRPRHLYAQKLKRPSARAETIGPGSLISGRKL